MVKIIQMKREKNSIRTEKFLVQKTTASLVAKKRIQKEVTQLDIS